MCRHALWERPSSSPGLPILGCAVSISLPVKGWVVLILVTVHIDFSYSLLVFLNDAKKTMTGLEKGKRKEK